MIIDNIIAAAFGNASAGPTAVKVLQHLSAGAGAPARQALQAELRSLGEGPLEAAMLQQLPFATAGAELVIMLPGAMLALLKIG